MIFIPHSTPTISTRDIKAVSRILQTGNLVQGPKVLEFETKVSHYLDMKAGVATNSGTSALHLALLALGIGPNDEVMMPSYVCSALLNAVSYVGATARIVDVNADDFNISFQDVKKKLNKKIKAIIVPHMFGHPADLKELLSFNVPIIEDCAQSIGAKYKGRKAGSFGALSVCSFYATKVMTTGEGGMVFSNQTKLLDRIRDLRQYDHAPNLKVRYNYKMTDFQAALGISQLQELPQFIQSRKHIAEAYDHAFAGMGIIIPHKEGDRDTIYYRYVVKVKTKAKSFIEQLKKKGIGASAPIFKPLHHYVKGSQCPVADQLMKQCVSIPIYPHLTQQYMRHIIDQSARACAPRR